MSDNFFDPSDPFGMQTSITPGLNTMHTTGVPKMLVVIFVIDCSRTMDGDRIGAVNAAMQEMQYKLSEFKNEYSLDLKVAVMSFASSAKWEITLTPIDEVNLQTIKTRPGLTSYGAAFHELNKVLRKEGFMKHTGKKAPPAIMFLTDGEPNDDYHDDLNDLLKNGWFANASRSAILLGDAIDNPEARDAVSHFVNDGNNDIVSASDSTVIIDKIRIATMHTIAGDPIQSDSSESNNSADQNNNTGNDLSQTDPSAIGSTDNTGIFGDPNNNIAVPSFPDFVDGSDDSNSPDVMDTASFTGIVSDGDDSMTGTNGSSNDPFGGSNDPFANLTNPFGDGNDPFGGGDDPFGGMI